MSTDHRVPVCDRSSLEAISKGPAPLTAGAMAALLSEVHASLLVHEDLSHLADELENVLFDVMIHARERKLTLDSRKPQLVLAQ
jgi:NTP pyrophosphatase (non-canonical NTP hydrolase)